MNLTDLEAFVCVVDTGSVTAAADALGVPKSTVSRRVSRLEDELGVSLLTRASRRVGVTETGRRLHARSAPALRELADAERTLMEATGEPSGVLRVTALPDMGSTRTFAEMFASFRAAWPQVRLEIVLTERVVDLIGEGFDVAIRPMLADATPTWDGLVMRRLAPMHAAMFASPAFLATHGAPTHPRELAALPCVAHRAFLARGPLMLHGPDGESFELEVAEPEIVTNDSAQLVELVLAGAGVGLAPHLMAWPWLRAGDLVAVLQGWNTAAGQLALVWPESRHMAPRVRAFIDHAAAHFAGRCAEHAG